MSFLPLIPRAPLNSEVSLELTSFPILTKKAPKAGANLPHASSTSKKAEQLKLQIQESRLRRIRINRDLLATKLLQRHGVQLAPRELEGMTEIELYRQLTLSRRKSLENKAAATIQAYWRVHAQNKNVHSLMVKLHHAALTIQIAWRHRPPPRPPSGPAPAPRVPATRALRKSSVAVISSAYLTYKVLFTQTRTTLLSRAKKIAQQVRRAQVN